MSHRAVGDGGAEGCSCTGGGGGVMTTTARGGGAGGVATQAVLSAATATQESHALTV